MTFSKRKFAITVLTICFLTTMFVSSSVTPATNVSADVKLSGTILVSSYTPHDAIEVHSNTELLDLASDEGWEGDGTEGNPIIIEGYSFDQWTQPIRIWNTDIHWIVRNNLIDGGPTVQCGTWFENTVNGVFTNNIVQHRHTAIVAIDCESLEISNNLVQDNREHGMETHDLLVNCIIENNTMINNPGEGMKLIGGMNESIITNNRFDGHGGNGIFISVGAFNSIISDNEIHDSERSGIYIQNAIRSEIVNNNITETTNSGISIAGGVDSTLKLNTLENCDEHGIKLTSAYGIKVLNNSINMCADCGLAVTSGDNITVAHNYIVSSTSYGVHLDEEASNVTVTMNVLITNGATCQIADNGAENTFIANYYAEWTSPDANSDGFVDSAYLSEGTAENSDAYPLADPQNIPEIPNPNPNPIESAFPMEIAALAGGVGIIVTLGIVVFLKRR